MTYERVCDLDGKFTFCAFHILHVWFKCNVYIHSTCTQNTSDVNKQVVVSEDKCFYYFLQKLNALSCSALYNVHVILWKHLDVYFNKHKYTTTAVQC